MSRGRFLSAAERKLAMDKVDGMLSENHGIWIACARTGISRASYTRWKVAFCEGGLKGLEDKPRSGRPKKTEPVVDGGECVAGE